MKKLVRALGIALTLSIAIVLWGLLIGPIGTTGLLLALLLGGLAIAAALFWSPKTPSIKLDEAKPADLPATASAWLAQRRQSLPAAAPLDAITSQLGLLQTQLTSLPANDGVAQDLDRLLKRHLPELVDRYTRVPVPQRTPDLEQAVVSGLAIVEAELARASQMLSQADRDAVHIQGRFLETRYGQPG